MSTCAPGRLSNDGGCWQSSSPPPPRRRGWPLDARHGPGLGRARAGARVRGRLRPGRPQSLPAPGALPSLASGPRRARVHTRAADVSTIELEGRRLRLTNLDKVLWPDAGRTKAWLIEYYTCVAPVLLPHIAGRPLTLRRFPDGVEGVSWHQNECRGEPEWFHVLETPGKAGRILRFCVVDDLSSLIWVANQGTLELHPFQWSVGAPRRPTA